LISFREQTIDSKEKRISELRMKAKELEKIKFVLDYKYKELKKEMEPKETQILHMKEQIKEMDEELERDVRTNHALGETLVLRQCCSSVAAVLQQCCSSVIMKLKGDVRTNHALGLNVGWELFQSGFFSWVAAKMTMSTFIGQALNDKTHLNPKP
jgi:acetylglutamate synthase